MEIVGPTDLREQLVEFVLLDPPTASGQYQVCGQCSGRMLNQTYTQWTCGEAVNVASSIVIVQKIIGCEEFKWKWKDLNRNYEIDGINNDRILHILSENCTINETLQVNSTWGVYDHSEHHSCMEANATSSETSYTTPSGRITTTKQSTSFFSSNSITTHLTANTTSTMSYAITNALTMLSSNTSIPRLTTTILPPSTKTANPTSSTTEKIHMKSGATIETTSEYHATSSGSMMTAFLSTEEPFTKQNLTNTVASTHPYTSTRDPLTATSTFHHSSEATFGGSESSASDYSSTESSLKRQ